MVSKRKPVLIRTCLGAASLLLCLGAQAEVVTLNSLFGGGIGTNVSASPLNIFLGNTLVGALSGSSVGGASFISHNLVTGGPFTFCVELGAPVNFGVSFNYTLVDPAVPSAYTAASLSNGWGPTATTISGRVDRLMQFALANLGGSSTTVVQDLGALQLALWNVIYDTDNLVEIGTFAVVGGASPVNLRANAFITGIASIASPSVHYSVLSNPGQQDVLGKVPEPASWALVGLALLGLHASRRRAAGS